LSASISRDGMSSSATSAVSSIVVIPASIAAALAFVSERECHKTVMDLS
jgi:hypothetical protein